MWSTTNPNNTLIWYYDEDLDGLGDDIFSVVGCDAPGEDFADNADDPCPYTELNDSDGDGICDDIDDCIGFVDALGVCNGDCENDDDNNGVCDDSEILGCIDTNACNYNSSATQDDGSCYNNDLGCGCDTPAADTGYDCDGNCLNDQDNDGICDEFEIEGCTDETACNYDRTATDKNGSS